MIVKTIINLFQVLAVIITSIYGRRTGGEGEVPLAELLRGGGRSPPADLATLTI